MNADELMKNLRLTALVGADLRRNCAENLSILEGEVQLARRR